MAKGKKEENTEFVNPFKPGVSYQDLIDALPEGVTVKEYLSGKEKEDGVKFTEDEINWISNECEAHLYHIAHKADNLKKAAEDHKRLMILNDAKLS